jgi:hypothetical protein
MKRIFDTSILVNFLRRLSFYFSSCLKAYEEVYSFSLLKKVNSFLLSHLKVYSKNSFLGKISEPVGISFAALDSSRVVAFLIRLNRILKNRMDNFLKVSGIRSSLKDLKEEFFLADMRNLSIIAICAISANLFLILFLKRHIGLIGLIERVIFLLIALGGLSSKASLEGVIENSLTAKYLNSLRSKT